MNPPYNTAQLRALLLDVEGTTTSVDFVYQTLFPYAREHLRGFVQRHCGDPAFMADIDRLRQEHGEESSRPRDRLSDCPSHFPQWTDSSQDELIASTVLYVHWLMDQDRKSTALKSLQGRIWEEGYRTGQLRGHVYPDVPPAFRRWRDQGKDICIFSSGSVLAQKLLFAHSVEGDLTGYISAYFDTTTGPKTAPGSYGKIAESLSLPPAQILFVSDTVAELDAAGSAGMRTALCVRSEAPGKESHGHPIVQDFAELQTGEGGVAPVN